VNYWSSIAPSIITLFSSLPTEGMTTTYREGVVLWFNRQVPFISTETMAGIYLRWVKVRLTSRVPGRDWRNVVRVINSMPVTNLQQDLRVAGQATLRVQVKSLESTDVSWSLWYLTNIQTNLWTEAAHEYLRRLGLSVINTGDVISNDAPIDQREASIGTLDINFNFAYTTTGALDYTTLESSAIGLHAHDSAVTGTPITGDITAP
jgi:hypothetical protein